MAIKRDRKKRRSAVGGPKEKARASKRGPAASKRRKIEELKRKVRDLSSAFKKTNEGIRVLYKELERKNRELQKLDQLKSDFISTVSHELRTPITIFREGICQILEAIHGPISKSQAEVLSMSLKNVDRLVRLINDLLDISKLEAGRVILRWKVINLATLIHSIANALRPSGAGDRLPVKLDVRMSAPAVHILGDYDRLHQVLTNLVSNALKFTKKGKVTITLDDYGDHVELSVIDTGRGIAEEDAVKVFGRFQQFGRIAGPGDQGTGLGLVISKQIVLLHGGEIGVESRLKAGTKFTFTLPKLTVRDVLTREIKQVYVSSPDPDIPCAVAVCRFDSGKPLQRTAAGLDHETLVTRVSEICEGGLRRKADRVIRDREFIWILLSETHKKQAPKVTARIDTALERELRQLNLREFVNWNWVYAGMPDDGRSESEMIEYVMARVANFEEKKTGGLG
ncbi:MAG: hypothetical protein A2Z83_06760 [Omnitrophica bacterium GWA2_52_8]|nr:MAG: hypothetical protein A2Z83_06760 [Omnitrophica bacterium GWA2_52_8]